MNHQTRIHQICLAAAAMAGFVLMWSGTRVQAAAVVLRLGNTLNGYADYTSNPTSFPVCKAGMTYMAYVPSYPISQRVFDTTNVMDEDGLYTTNTIYTGTNDVVPSLASYESNGFTVVSAFLYREDWIQGWTPTGLCTNEWRLLSTNEIANVRKAIASSALKCKNTVKLIQLIGGRVPPERGDSWFGLSDQIKTNLLLLDGIGTECHVGDYTQQSLTDDNQPTLQTMAAMARWATDNGKLAFVFMGGAAATYTNLTPVQLTYEYLWREMAKVGINYRATNIIYLRQGGRPGNMVPESAGNTLTHQMRWLINTLASSNSLFVSEMLDQTMASGITAQIPFAVGEVEVPLNSLMVSAVSANQSLVANTNLLITGHGANRSLSVTPNPGQTGTTTITLAVSDRTNVQTSAFQLTVTPFSAVASTSSGDINDINTWGGRVPVAGDANVWRTGGNVVNLLSSAAGTNLVNFYGGALEVQTNGQFAPGQPTVTLALNNLTLSGGSIYMANNQGLNLDFSGQQCTLNSGTLKAGTGSTMDVIMEDGVLAGNGFINVTGVNANGGEVQFTSSINLLGFTGGFNVTGNGLLELPYINPDDASFRLNLSGTGQYLNDAEAAVTALTIAGVAFANGVYAYTNFSPAQQAFMLNNGGTITVTGTNAPPAIGNLPDVTINQDTPTNISFTVGDAETASGALAVGGFASNPALVPATNLIFSGSGSNRTVTIFPAFNQTGATTINLAASDGTNTIVRPFALTVVAGPDADGDGMADSAETILGRNPNSASDLGFEFNTDGSFDGWGSFSNINSAMVSGGELTGTSSTTDPHFARYGFAISGNSISNIAVKIRLASADTVQLYWQRTGSNTFSSARMINLAYTTPNAWQTLIFPVSTSAEWNGQTITALRIDPGITTAQNFEMDWIRALNGNMTAPAISAVSNQMVTANALTPALPFTVGSNWTPASSLTVVGYSANPGLLPNANIVLGGSGASRTVTLTPAANQTGVATIQIVVSDGVLAATNSFTLTVTANTAPILAALGSQTITAGHRLTLTNAATDPDTPPQALMFSLLSPPAGAAVTSNGIFTWRPTIAQSPSTNTIRVMVADNGTPVLSATNSFSVTVNAPIRPGLSAGSFSNGIFTLAVSGDTGPDYVLQTSTNLSLWQSVMTNYSPSLPFNWNVSPATNQPAGFFRVNLQP